MRHYYWIYRADAPHLGANYVEAIVGPFNTVHERADAAPFIRALHPDKKVVPGAIWESDFNQPHMIEMFERCGVEIPKKGTS